MEKSDKVYKRRLESRVEGGKTTAEGISGIGAIVLENHKALYLFVFKKWGELGCVN